MPNPPKSVILRARVDQPLYDALLCSARAAGVPVADLVRDTLRAAHDRRARICLSLGLPRDVSDTDLFEVLRQEMILLTPIEQQTAREITDVGQALGFAAARAANKRRNARTSKPAPSRGTKPPEQRSASSTQALQSWRSAPDTLRLVGAGTALQVRAAKSETAALPTEFLLFRAGENPSTKGSVVFDRRASDLVMAAYRRHGTRLMVDLEHQALFGLGGDASDARGWADIELRSGALYAVNVEWTPDGARRLREKTQLYTSPAFLVELKERETTPRVVELINVAITALPATHGLAPLMRGGK